MIIDGDQVRINGITYKDVSTASLKTGIARSTIHSAIGRNNSRVLIMKTDGGRSLSVWCDGEKFQSRVALALHLGYTHGSAVNKHISMAKREGKKSFKLKGRIITWEEQ